MDYWYHSPLREERTPSFKVNTRSNVWYDHGTGEGGTILDLGMKLHDCTLQEFLEKLSKGKYSPVSFQPQQSAAEAAKGKVEIISADHLRNQDLVRYLAGRGIDIGTARKYCLEIEFRISPRTYVAVGFPNQSGGYELRNRWFKGSSSPKDISFVKAESRRICVLEGFMDFLSVFKLDEPGIKKLTDNSNFLILNSLRLLTRSLPVILLYDEVIIFLDNDLAGKQAREFLREKGVQFRDASILFATYKDVNEYLIAKLKDGSERKFIPKDSLSKKRK